MKKIFIFLLLISVQSAFPQSNQITLDGKYFYLGNSWSEIKNIFDFPFYSFSVDSTLPHWKDAYLFKEVNQEIKILGLFTFIGDKLTSFKKIWLFSPNTESYSDFEKLYYALKSIYDNDYSVTINFKEDNEPNSSSKSVILSNGEKDTEIKINQVEDQNSIMVSELKMVTDINMFDYEKSYYLTFLDYKEMNGDKKIINEFYDTLDKASRRFRELSIKYLTMGIPVNGSILTVILPRSKSK